MRGRIIKSYSATEFDIDVGLDSRRIKVCEEPHPTTGKPYRCRIFINGKERPDGKKGDGSPLDCYTTFDLRGGDMVEVDGNPAVRLNVTRG